ncbi:hypothetical protein RFI_05921, partial [Reticulomyxa filosa]
KKKNDLQNADLMITKSDTKSNDKTKLKKEKKKKKSKKNKEKHKHKTKSGTKKKKKRHKHDSPAESNTANHIDKPDSTTTAVTSNEMLFNGSTNGNANVFSQPSSYLANQGSVINNANSVNNVNNDIAKATAPNLFGLCPYYFCSTDGQGLTSGIAPYGYYPNYYQYYYNTPGPVFNTLWSTSAMGANNGGFIPLMAPTTAAAAAPMCNSGGFANNGIFSMPSLCSNSANSSSVASTNSVGNVGLESTPSSTTSPNSTIGGGSIKPGTSDPTYHSYLQYYRQYYHMMSHHGNIGSTGIAQQTPGVSPMFIGNNHNFPLSFWGIKNNIDNNVGSESILPVFNMEGISKKCNPKDTKSNHENNNCDSNKDNPNDNMVLSFYDPLAGNEVTHHMMSTTNGNNELATLDHLDVS